MLDIILMIVASLLIILSLLQGGKSEGASSAFTGGSNMNLFANTKERGPELIISRLTMIVGVLFFILVILVRVI